MLETNEPSGTIWWLRHGPTHTSGMVGWSDLPADLSGTEALERLSDALPEDAALVSSDLARAVTTADAVARGRHRLPHDPGLREMHFGDWELRRHAEIEAEEPELIRAFWEAPDAVRPPGGELWGEMADRVEVAVTRLLADHGALVVVAHFGPILSQAQRARGWTCTETLAQPIEPLSLTRIEYGPRRLREINHRP